MLRLASRSLILRRLVVKPMSTGPLFVEVVRVVHVEPIKRRIAGSTIKQTMAIAVKVATSRCFTAVKVIFGAEMQFALRT